MKFLLTKLMICFALHSAAQTTPPNSIARTLAGQFSKVSVSTGVELYLTQGNESAVSIIVSDSRYEAGFKTEVVDGTLKIYYDSKNKSTKMKNVQMKAYVTYKNLEAISCAAGSITNLTNTLKTGLLNLTVSSGSIIKGAINAGNVTVNSSSGAEAIISGNVEKLQVTSHSGSIFKGANLVSNYCIASAHSGGTIKIEVQKELTASAHSGGDIKYTGNATLIKTDLHSGGSVKKAK
ncbi:MAG TPA: head GIN domain-containing protein [Ferruginibacter sp.]|nr:head GIN domain-containing protein [Ferruginibacter sp.]HRE63530.1 head GIN domain-containing protein [Ferruginibacter sp.]